MILSRIELYLEKSVILRWNNKPFEPRYYQKDVIEKAISCGRGVVESAVGTGKSLMMAYIIKQLSVNSLIIVPSRGLLEQMYQDLVLWFGAKNVDMVNSTKVRSGKALKPIRITTIQTVASLLKTNEEMEDFLKTSTHFLWTSFITLVAVLTLHYLDPSVTSTTDSGSLGPFLGTTVKVLICLAYCPIRIYHYPAFKAITEGFLTPLKVIRYNLHGKAHKQYQKEYDLNYCGSKEISFRGCSVEFLVVTPELRIILHRFQFLRCFPIQQLVSALVLVLVLVQLQHKMLRHYLLDNLLLLL